MESIPAPLIAGIFTIVGAVIGLIGSSFERRQAESRAAQSAKAERLSANYQAVLAATWMMQETTDRWGQGNATDGEHALVANAHDALVRLALDDDAQEVKECFNVTAMRYASWRRNQSFYLAHKDATDPAIRADVNTATATMRQDHAAIRSNADRIERLARTHIATLRKPARPRWQFWKR